MTRSLKSTGKQGFRNGKDRHTDTQLTDIATKRLKIIKKNKRRKEEEKRKRKSVSNSFRLQLCQTTSLSDYSSVKLHLCQIASLSDVISVRLQLCQNTACQITVRLQLCQTKVCKTMSDYNCILLQRCQAEAVCCPTTAIVDIEYSPTLSRYGLASTPEIDAAFYFDLAVRSLRDILSTVLD